MTAPGSVEPTSIGRYELSSTLGVGGFATVYRAHDPALDGDVALKVLLAQFVDNRNIRNRFLQEARLLRRVDSPNVVQVYDIGELEDGRPYFVMELADGGVLSDRLARRHGPIDRVSLTQVVDALADGLAALHETSIIHRDIKPDNLLIAGTGRADTTQIGGSLLADGERLIIGDLGLAKDHDRTSAGPTVAGGTPFYRPPEQMTPGAPITPAADIYAATAVLWCMLSGTHPPEAQAVPAQLPSMPAAWQPVLERGLEQDPTLRFATIDEWAAEARHAIEGSPATGVEPVTVGDAASLCPYKGMAAFQPEDAGLFFGRSDMIDTLVGRLQDHPVVVIGGPSGSGKSSLMRAGLIPRLDRGAIAGSQLWRVALFTPGGDAVGELVHQLRRLDTPPSSKSSSVSDHDDPLTRDQLPDRARHWLDDGPPALLAIDQFEELFTLNPSRVDRELFLDTLAAMTESAHTRIRVAIALRADFYGVCATHPWLSDRINESQLLVGPMSREELRDAITQPAQRAGLQLEAGLADMILDDVGPGGGALPLLGHALMETWIRRRGSHLTIEGYRAAGGVSEAIAQRAEDVFNQLGPAEQDAARKLLLQLINPGEGTPDTRRRVSRQSLPARTDLEPVLEKLAAARLLTVDDDAVEVAHEALIQSWPRLRSWIDDNRESLQTRRRIGTAAAEWLAADRSPDLLYRGTQLAGAFEWLEEHPEVLDETATEFLLTAGEVRDRAERERAAAMARTRRNRRRAIGALAVLAAAAVASSVVAFGALRRSQANEREAEAQQVQALAAAASANATDQPLLATGLAVESIARAEPSSASARAALVEARVGLDANRLLPQPFGYPVTVGDMLSLAVTADGERFITGGRQGDVVFWDRVTRQEVHRVTDIHDSGVKALAVSADGRWLMSVGGVEAALWDLTAERPQPIILHEIERDGSNTIWDVAFSPDGTKVGLATEGAGVLVLDRASRSQISDGMADISFDFLSLAFLDEQRLAVGDGTGQLHMMAVADGDPIADPVVAGDNGNDIWELVPDRDRGLLMTVSTDNTVKSWRIEPDGFVREAVLQEDALLHPAGAVLAGSGLELVVGAADGRLYRVDPARGELIPGGVSAALHTDELRDSALSSNGWLFTLADDQRVQIWQYVGEVAQADRVIADTDPVTELALSPSAELLVAATETGTVILDSQTGQVLHRLGGPVQSAAFVGDGSVVTGSGDGALQLWDAERGVLRAEGAGHSGSAIRSLTVSADGELVASGGGDGSVILWSGEDLDRVRDLAGHGGEVTGIDFTPDDATVVSLGWDQRLRFSAVDGGSSREVAVDQDGPQALVVHPDGQHLAIGGAIETIEILDFDGALLRSMAPHPGGVWDLALTADGLSLVGTSRNTGEMQLWDWDTGERLGPPFGQAYERREPDVVVGSDGTVWSSGTDGAIRKLDVLNQDVACEISRDVIGSRMQDQFLSGDETRSCRS